MGDGVGVDVSWECLLSMDVWVGDPAVLQSEALQLPRLTGQLPVHLHGRLVQDLSEETGRTGNCGTDRDRLWLHSGQTFKVDSMKVFKVDVPPPCVVAVMVLDC